MLFELTEAVRERVQNNTTRGKVNESTAELNTTRRAKPFTDYPRLCDDNPAHSYCTHVRERLRAIDSDQQGMTRLERGGDILRCAGTEWETDIGSIWTLL